MMKKNEDANMANVKIRCEDVTSKSELNVKESISERNKQEGMLHVTTS